MVLVEEDAAAVLVSAALRCDDDSWKQRTLGCALVNELWIDGARNALER